MLNYKSYRGIIGLLSFSTIIPTNVHTTIEEMAKFTWFWPVIGGFIGIFVGGVGFLLSFYLPKLVVASFVYGFAIFFTGFHHLDGLMDFGDGVMAHGDYKRKIEVMKDSKIGTGGISSFFIVGILTISAISSLPLNSIFPLLFVSEMAAKIGLITCSTFSKPVSDGTGRFFILSMNIKLLMCSLLITFFLGFLACKVIGIFGIVGGVIGGIAVAVIAAKNFKSATGDVLGAANEISRMISLIIMTGMISWKFTF